VPEREILDSLLEQGAPPTGVCHLPPPGWRCTRISGHVGPCAAIPETDELKSSTFYQPGEIIWVPFREMGLADSLEDFLPASRWERLNGWLRDWADTLRYDLGDALEWLAHRIRP
jgi:hypothetical protein